MASEGVVVEGSTQRWRVFVGFGMRFGEMERGGAPGKHWIDVGPRE